MTIGERLRDTRVDKDHTQKDTSQLLGTSDRQIGKYERNEQEMTVSKLKAFCEHYGVSADYILGLPKGLTWPR